MDKSTTNCYRPLFSLIVVHKKREWFLANMHSALYLWISGRKKSVFLPLWKKHRFLFVLSENYKLTDIVIVVSEEYLVTGLNIACGCIGNCAVFGVEDDNLWLSCIEI